MKVFSDHMLEKRRRWARKENSQRVDVWKEEQDRMDVVRTWSELCQIRRLIERDGLYCCWCGSLCDPRLRPSADLFPTREHVIRKADGGKSGMGNLKIACRKCNNSRHHAGWRPLHVDTV